eukprot:9998135-Alexandrium_andersonii.AAC.1
MPGPLPPASPPPVGGLPLLRAQEGVLLLRPVSEIPAGTKLVALESRCQFRMGDIIPPECM